MDCIKKILAVFICDGLLGDGGLFVFKLVLKFDSHYFCIKLIINKK